MKENSSKKKKTSPLTKKSPKKHDDTSLKETKYEIFVREHKKTWMWFNFIAILISLGSAIGTFLVLNVEEPKCPFGSLRIALWLVFSMHLVNVFEFFINLTGLERNFCNGSMMCIYFIFEITVLVYM